MTRVSMNECAQCSADIITPEWSEHLSDYCIRHVWSCEACGYRYEDTVYLSRESAAANSITSPVLMRSTLSWLSTAPLKLVWPRGRLASIPQ